MNNIAKLFIAKLLATARKQGAIRGGPFTRRSHLGLALLQHVVGHARTAALVARGRPDLKSGGRAQQLAASGTRGTGAWVSHSAACRGSHCMSLAPKTYAITWASFSICWASMPRCVIQGVATRRPLELAAVASPGSVFWASVGKRQAAVARICCGKSRAPLSTLLHTHTHSPDPSRKAHRLAHFKLSTFVPCCK